jgi:hypothetical protein
MPKGERNKKNSRSIQQRGEKEGKLEEHTDRGETQHESFHQ